MLLMLEDNSERVQRFTEILRTIDPNSSLLIWPDAHAMIREVTEHLSGAHLISLDHDLEPRDDVSDPGDGLDVVKFLVSQPIVRPVVIHTSNFERSSLMASEFKLAGWPFVRITPIGDDWIEVDWQRAVRRLLGRSGG